MNLLPAFRLCRWATALAIVFLSVGAPAYAQRPPGSEPTPNPRPVPERPEPGVVPPGPFEPEMSAAADALDDVSVSLSYVQAAGEFRKNVRIAFGITVSTHHPFGRARVLGLGLEGGYFLYGGDTRRLSGPGFGTSAEVETKSRIVTLGVGPRIARAIGPLEPYASGSVGAAVFLTDSCIRQASSVFPQDDECHDHSADAIDVAPAASLGAGLQIRLKKGSLPLYLHLGTRYLMTGPVRYVTQASIVIDPDDNTSFQSVQTSTQMWVFQLGLSGRL